MILLFQMKSGQSSNFIPTPFFLLFMERISLSKIINNQLKYTGKRISLQVMQKQNSGKHTQLLFNKHKGTLSLDYG